MSRKAVMPTRSSATAWLGVQELPDGGQTRRPLADRVTILGRRDPREDIRETAIKGEPLLAVAISTLPEHDPGELWVVAEDDRRLACDQRPEPFPPAILQPREVVRVAGERLAEIADHDLAEPLAVKADPRQG